MRTTDVDMATQEARRFLRRVEEMEKQVSPTEFGEWFGPEAAAVKRASLDLTRALAKMRKPWRYVPPVEE